MNNISFDLINLFQKYGMNPKSILEENQNLDYLYALSGQRENVIEWFDFASDSKLLQVGADYGALTGLYSRRTGEVCVLEEDADMIELCKVRYAGEENVRFCAESLSEHASKAAGTYDYVMMIGSLRKPYEAGLEAAKALLKPNGTLILAVCNKFGMKYWAGCPRDEDSFSKRELEALFKDSFGLKWYYPMPDYKLPVTIYSQSYLPKKGDLTHTVTAYDYPKYIRLDVGERYDEVCECGEFESYANSFLVVWKKPAEA